MSQIIYDLGCETELQQHYCDECPVSEGARVSSIAVVSDRITFVVEDSLSEWQDKIASGEIKLIPSVRGTFDGGQPEMKPGFGRVQEVVSRYKYSLEYLDPTLFLNYTFYNNLKNVRNQRCWYATENLFWLTDKPASWAPGAPVTDNTQDDVFWNTKVSWVSGNLPKPIVIPEGIIGCFVITD